MKRIITLFTAIVGFTTISHAQLKPDFDFGIKLGANLNQVDGEYLKNGYKANILGGLYGGVNWAKLGVQVEALFSQSTFTTGDRFGNVYSNFLKNTADSVRGGSFKVNYLNIPLLLNIKLFSRATIQLGPQYSGVVSVKDKDALLKDAKGLFKSGDMSGVIGVWLNLPAHLNVGARYIIGFSNINDADGSNIGSTSAKIDDSWKQRTLQLHVGYSFL